MWGVLGYAGALSVVTMSMWRLYLRFPREPEVSIIIPAHNAMPHLEETLKSVLRQKGILRKYIEVSIYNDCSSDDTAEAIAKWVQIFKACGIRTVVGGKSKESKEDEPSGDGAARNHAVRQSSGRFFHRSVFQRAGGYPELKGLNDLEFFHRHLDAGGDLVKDPEILLMYRYSSTSLSWKSSRRELLLARVRPFQRRVISRWERFSIWGAGRDGHNFFKALSESEKDKVEAFCDVDSKKIKRGFISGTRKLPVVHWSKLCRMKNFTGNLNTVRPPFVVCVAKGRTGGQLEANIASFGLVEGKDYWHFS
eukprot:jgi/Bigna1/78330/fgenesh1_pg.54_\